MQTLSIPEPRDAQSAALLARIFERSHFLRSAGYDWSAFALKLFRVFKPENTEKVKADYWVDLTLQTCSCECFEKHGVCKHYLAVEEEFVLCEKEEEEANALVEFPSWMLYAA